MSSQRKKENAFSLVELVIVIVIIGIVAAIAVPRISRGAKGAVESAVRGDLAALRAAIDLYAAEHTGDFPGNLDDSGDGSTGNDADFVTQLTRFSDITGKIGGYDAVNGIIYGPYLRAGIPKLPVGATPTSAVLFDRTNSPPTPTNVGGWVYNPETGEILANSDEQDEAGNEYNTY